MGSSSQCVHRLMTFKIFCWCTTFCRWSLIFLVWHVNSSDMTHAPSHLSLHFSIGLLSFPSPIPASGHSLDLWSFLTHQKDQVVSWAEISIFLCLLLLSFITCPKHPLLFPDLLLLASWTWCLLVMPLRHPSSLLWHTIAEWAVSCGSQHTVALWEPCYLIIPACPRLNKCLWRKLINKRVNYSGRYSKTVVLENYRF